MAYVEGDLFGEYPRTVREDAGKGWEEDLFEVSSRAYDAAIHAGMSELPVEADIARYIQGVMAAALEAPGGIKSPAAREAADRRACDRGDPVVQVVLDAAYRVVREIDRLKGLLRFGLVPANFRSGGPETCYLARCAPDHFILPALADYFTLRFGDTPWAIVDERRGLCLVRPPGEAARINTLPVPFLLLPAGKPADEKWEALWRNYHCSINNRDRKNLPLQRRFMPARYWKYLPEMN
jgi:probable DNA metabolism protein